MLASRKYTYRSKKKSWMPRTSTAPEVRQMGIAAGGKLIQDIYQDKYPSHIWDSGRARLVNVHILDSSIFEALTHIVPPMVPLTPQAYKEAGLPFYVLEEEIDNRIDGGQALKEVKSVSTMDKEVGVGSGSDTTGDTLRPKGCEICKVRLCDCMYVSSFRSRPDALHLFPAPLYATLGQSSPWVSLFAHKHRLHQRPTMQPPILQFMHQDGGVYLTPRPPHRRRSVHSRRCRRKRYDRHHGLDVSHLLDSHHEGHWLFGPDESPRRGNVQGGRAGPDVGD